MSFEVPHTISVTNDSIGKLYIGRVGKCIVQCHHIKMTSVVFRTAHIMNVNIKQSHYTPWRCREESRYSSYSFMNSTLDGDEW
jgi:hypothetical protein